jgi:hypothetical protein
MTTNTPSTSEAKAMIDDLAVAMSQYGQSTWVSISDGDRFQAPGNFADAVLALMRSYEESHATIARLESLLKYIRTALDSDLNSPASVTDHIALEEYRRAYEQIADITESIDAALTPKEGARE